jgi:DNA-3-methyladenine glycosylase II
VPAGRPGRTKLIIGPDWREAVLDTERLVRRIVVPRMGTEGTTGAYTISRAGPRASSSATDRRCGTALSDPAGSIDAMTTRTFTIQPAGPFSLRESALFGFGQRHDQRFDDVMRLVFCIDGGYDGQVGVELRQDPGPDPVSGAVHAVVHGDGALDAVREQVARVLSLDYDANEFLEVGRRDPTIRRLQLAAPGLRPPLFYSPYEAAAWSIISARRPAMQMAQVRRRLSEAHGAVFDLAGTTLAALPTPRQLLAVSEFPALPAEKIERLHGVARAALDGRLDVHRLKELGPEAASAQLQQIKGIGPFYSALITVRAIGFADVLVTAEPKAADLIRDLYSLPSAPTQDQLAAIAEPWRPFRTWATVLIRAAAGRLQRAAA